MKKKQGISLIVLVITIIVMVILVAAVVITLNNTGIIGRANEAVEKTNLKQVKQIAALAWSEAFMDGLTGDELKEAVLDKLDDYTDEFDIDVTDDGVTVTPVGSGAAEKNEYGFYYNYLYIFDKAEMMGCSSEMLGVYITEENLVVLCALVFVQEEDVLKTMEVAMQPLAGIVNIDKENRLLMPGSGNAIPYSSDGKQITIEGMTATVYTDKKITGMKQNTDYIATVDGKEYKINLTDENEFIAYVDNVEVQKFELTTESFVFDKLILDVDGRTIGASLFGDRIGADGQDGVYEISGTNNEIKKNVTYKATSGNTLRIDDQNVITLTKDGVTTTLNTHELKGDVMWEQGKYAIYSFAGGEIIAFIDMDIGITEYYRVEK